MKKHILFSIVLTGLMTLGSCKKDSDETLIPSGSEETSLELRLTDNLGNTVTGASVKLYDSATDWANGTNQIGITQYSDIYGKVTFNNLAPIQYYWLAKKDCKNNVNGGVTTTSSLTKGRKNTLGSISLTSTGDLKFENNSKNPYKVYINGKFSFQVSGLSTKYQNHLPIGDYSIKVVQVSGYALYPTKQTFSPSLACGDYQSISFPN